ncbi:hypothetical protein HDV01_000034 [Terramyces sp. JEL0728]|nr:hypothetical protein HDV01_000034 [Terramyces sp. JEL0728]
MMHLAKLKKQEVVNHCLKFGLPLTGTKPELIDQIIQQCETLKIPREVIAIDVGTTNIGYVHMQLSGHTPSKHILKVKEWKLVDPNFPKSFDLVNYSKLLHDNIPRKDVLYLIEKQSYRLGTRIPYGVLKTNAIEALLCGLLVNQVEQISPQSVAKYYDMPKSNYKEKKKKSVELATGLISNGKIALSEKDRRMFESEKKKDDLSDCLLMVHAYFQWKLSLLDFSRLFK